MKNAKLCLLSMGLLLLFALGGCAKEGATENSPRVEDSPALAFWRQHYPHQTLILWDQGDITGNGCLDTAIIFNIRPGENVLVVVLDDEGGFRLTEEFPAPVENQAIAFKDIDDKPPVELIVTGTKGMYVGYGIFRMEGGILVNLFPHDYDLCC